MVMWYNFAGVSDEVEASDIVVGKIFVCIVDTSVYNGHNHIAVSGGVCFPYWNHIDVSTFRIV